MVSNNWAHVAHRAFSALPNASSGGLTRRNRYDSVRSYTILTAPPTMKGALGPIDVVLTHILPGSHLSSPVAVTYAGAKDVGERPAKTIEAHGVIRMGRGTAFPAQEMTTRVSSPNS